MVLVTCNFSENKTPQLILIRYNNVTTDAFAEHYTQRPEKLSVSHFLLCTNYVVKEKKH